MRFFAAAAAGATRILTASALTIDGEVASAQA
jgi:hypothetical protein